MTKSGNVTKISDKNWHSVKSKYLKNKKTIKKWYYKKHQNNKCLLVLAMYYVYNKFLWKNWNLPLNFGFFHFFTRSSTFLTAC